MLLTVVVVMQLFFYYVLLYWRNNPRANYRDGTGAKWNASNNQQTEARRKEN
jgi:hypothetical protein